MTNKNNKVYGPLYKDDFEKQILNNYYEEYAPNDIPEPSEIKAYLDDFIIGQDEVKMAISVTAVRHLYVSKFNLELSLDKQIKNYFTDIYTILDSNNDFNYQYPIKKQNLMIIGASGTGKTLCVSKLAEYLQIPYYVADATSLTAAGYVGENVDYMLAGLLKAAKNNLSLAERGIIFIDEIDKIVRKEEERRDVGGLEVQHALLKLIEGGIVRVDMRDAGVYKGQAKESSFPFDTSNVLFIFGGAFTDLREFLNKKSKRFKMGIGSISERKHFKITIKDLLGAGLTPEFLGRLNTIIETKELTKKDLKKIMVQPKDSLISQYKVIFKLMGKEWKINNEEKLIDKVVKRAVLLKIGARGLATVMEEELRDKLYE